MADIGQGIPFRAGTFDGAISFVQLSLAMSRVLTISYSHSVSVLQWLCNADATSHSPPQRLLRFFTDLFGVLTRGSRAVFQFYPESDDQVKFIMNFATRAGFGGGLVVDYVGFHSSTILFLSCELTKHPTLIRTAQLLEKVVIGSLLTVHYVAIDRSPCTGKSSI